MKSDARQQLVERQQLDAELRGAGRRHVRVVGDDVRAERGEPLGDQLADAAEPDHADRLAEDLGARERRPLPGVLAQRRVGGRDLARGGQQQRERVLGGAVDVRRRRVDDQHAARGGGVDVDVVQADTGAGDDLELGRGGEHLGVDGGRRAHQQRVGLRHRGQQLLSVGAVDPADLDLVTEGGDGRFGEFVGDQYNGQAHPASLMGVSDCGDGACTVVGSGPNGLAAAVICAQSRIVGAGVRGPADAGRRRAHPARPGVLRRGPRHLLGRAPAGAGVAVLRGVRPARPRRAAGRPRDLLRQSAAGPARRDRLPRPGRTCAELDDGASWRRLLGPLARRQRRCAGVLARRQAFDAAGSWRPPCASACGCWPRARPAWRATSRRGRPRAVHRRCRAHDFARCRRWCPPAPG